MLQRILFCALAPLVAAVLALAPATTPTAPAKETARETAKKIVLVQERKPQPRNKFKVRWVPAARASYERAHRPDSKINRIIIHVAQAPAGSVLNTFRNGNVSASSHYVVSSRGQVFHMVPDRSIAWHSGNRHYNATSIGIEHAGYVQKKKSLTKPMYRASARLIAKLSDKYGIPLNRQHVIGHNEVPDPNNPRQRGGFDHHSDPGRYWKWGEYMRYARAFEREAEGTAKRAPEVKMKPEAAKRELEGEPKPQTLKPLDEIVRNLR